MFLQDIVATSTAVAATRSRTTKARLVAEALDRAAPEERVLVAHYLAGRLPQRRTGLGWRSLADLPDPVDLGAAIQAGTGGPPGLAVSEVDHVLSELERLAGPGSALARAEVTRALFARATAAEQQWLRSAILGEVRQGASDAVLIEALASAASAPVVALRRAAMLAGGAPAIVPAAYAGTLADVGLMVGRPVLPMLASSAPDIASAWAGLSRGEDRRIAVDTKLDGIRIQVHRDRDEVRIATRSLDDITDRLPQVVHLVRSLPAERLVLDGEALLVGDGGRPRPFQETAGQAARHDTAEAQLAPYFFDLLHRDGRDLMDAPAEERWAELGEIVPADHLVPRWVGTDRDAAEAFAADALEAGHEGVVVKDPTAPYAAGRRGAAWVKVKPVHTLDLVVLAVEWGSGRRRGWLSNIHLGARGPGGEPVMVGKTFKGMTDAMLAWQTERFLGLETGREGHVVHVRPEQVVEIAIDGVQRSSRYPGGVALRFARVVRYREDKSAAQADTIEIVRALLA